MKNISDFTLVATYDRAHRATRRTPEIDTTEALAEELMHNRVFFDLLERVAGYAVQHDLGLRCSYGRDSNGSPPQWSIQLGAPGESPDDNNAEQFMAETGVVDPVLGEAVRILATRIGILK